MQDVTTYSYPNFNDSLAKQNQYVTLCGTITTGAFVNYRKVSNIRRTKYQNFNASRFI